MVQDPLIHGETNQNGRKISWIHVETDKINTERSMHTYNN
jgi:hypothetical protein